MVDGGNNDEARSQLFNLRLKLFNYSRDRFYPWLLGLAAHARVPANGVGCLGAVSYYTLMNIRDSHGEPCS